MRGPVTTKKRRDPGAVLEPRFVHVEARRVELMRLSGSTWWWVYDTKQMTPVPAMCGRRLPLVNLKRIRIFAQAGTADGMQQPAVEAV